RIGRSAWLVRSTAEKLRAGSAHPLSGGEGLIAAFDCAWSGNDRQARTAEGRVLTGEGDDCIFFFEVAADELVRLADPDEFLPSGLSSQRPRLHFALVARDAHRRALSSGHGVRPISERFNLLADRAHLLFGGVRLHHDQHAFTSEISSLA